MSRGGPERWRQSRWSTCRRRTGEVDAEAFELGGGVAVHKDEVEVVAQVALDGLDGSVISEGAHQHGWVVPLLDEVGDIQVVRLADRRKYLFGQIMPCSFLQK